MPIKILIIVCLLNIALVQSTTDIEMDKYIQIITKHADDLSHKLDEVAVHYDAEIKKIVDIAKYEVNMIKNQAKNPVPLNFIYVQLPGQLHPEKLWPKTKWTSVTSMYKGSFFRVVGGEAKPWGEFQDAHFPRITTIKTMTINGLQTSVPKGQKQKPSKPHDLVKNNFNGWGASNQWTEGAFPTNFYHSNSDNYPRNKAVRIWKRTG